jgi:hypothetical protein
MDGSARTHLNGPGRPQASGGGSSLSNYRLLLRISAAARPETLDFEDLARAINHVEGLGDFFEAELWCGDEYLASVHASRTRGKIWTVGHPKSDGKPPS